MIQTVLAVFSTILLLSGCAHVMSEANLKLVDRSIRYERLHTNPDAFAGKTVLLGGIIAGATTTGDLSQLEVAQLELFNNEVPNEFSNSGGRFLAISAEPIDPVIYSRGKFVTIIGEVKGRKVQQRDGADYPYPLISVKELRLFQPVEPLPETENPYQNRIGDEKFQLRPPGLPGGEPIRPWQVREP